VVIDWAKSQDVVVQEHTRRSVEGRYVAASVDSIDSIAELTIFPRGLRAVWD